MKNRSKMAGLLLVITMLSFPEHAFTLEIRGVVQDAKTQVFLKGADIVLRHTTWGNSTDALGGFVITGVAAGKYELFVSLLGYQSKSLKILITDKSDAPLTIKLNPVLLTMESVQVTGKTYRNVRSIPDIKSEALEISITEIPKITIKQQQAKTLVEALNYVPGAVTETRGRKVKQFLSFRGQRYPYPDYAVDGVWQKEFLELPYFFSARDVESIEVVRSSAVLLTGLSGLAGVVNFKTREYDKTETDYQLEYGSYNSMRAHLSHGAKIKTLSYATGLGYSKTKGPGGKHAAEQVSNFFGKVKWQPRENLQFQSSAFYLSADREFLLAEPPADPRYWQVLEQYDPLKALLLTFTGHYTTGKKTATEFKASFADRRPAYKSLNTLTNETTRYTEADHELNLNLIQAVSPFSDNIMRVGFFYNHWVAPNGKRFYFGKPCDTETFSGVLLDEQRLGRLYLDAGMRWEKTHLNRYGAFSINESTKGLQLVSPILNTWQRPVLMSTLGAVYHFTKSFSLHAHSALGKVEPREGTLSVTLLEPLTESQTKADLGLQKFFSATGRFSLVSFITKQKDAIALSGTTKTLNGRVMELYLNRDQQQVGVEAEWHSPFVWQRIRSFANVTYLISKAEQKGEMVRNEEYPQWIAAAGILWQGQRLGLNLLGKFMSDFKSSQFLPTVAGKTMAPQPLGDFINLDAILTWNVFPRQRVQLFGEIRNLTDKRYTTSIGYPDFGRRFNVGVNQNW